METFLFFLQNISPLLCSYMLTRKYFSFKGYVDTLLAFLILFYAQIIATIIVLGTLHILCLRNVLLFNFAMFFLIWFIARPAQDYNVRDDLYKFISWLRAFSVTDKIVIFCFSLICGFALVKVVVNLVNPPFGWDDLNYHFTFAVEWFKNGTLATPIVVSDYPAPSYYPLNASFIFYWLLLPFKNVFLADIGQVPFYGIVFLSMYSIGKKIGLNRRFSFYAAILLLLTPNYFKQMKIAYVDVMVTAFFLLGLNFLFNLQKNFNIKNILLIGLSTGLLIGTKIIAIPHALIIALYFLWLSYLVCVRDRLYFRLLLSGIIFILAILSMGGFSYVRNFIMTGNPLYPLNVNMWGVTLFKGVLGGEFINNSENSFGWGKFLFSEGVGAGFILYAIPGLILAGIGLIKKRPQHKPYLWLLFTLIPFLYFVYRFGVGIPNTRYLYPWFAVCYILAIWGISVFMIPEKWVRYGLIVCALASSGEFARRQELIFSFMLSILLFVIFLNAYKIKRSLLVKPFMAFYIIFIIGASFLQYFYIDYSKNELKRYKSSRKSSGFWPEAIDAWIWLDQNTNGNNVAYVGRPVPFPLYGTKLKNSVFYVPVNEGGPYLHLYKNAWYSCQGGYENFHNVLMEANNYRGKADYNTWLKNLREKNTNFLFAYSLHQIKGIDFPIEDDWAKAHQEIFSLVFVNKIIHIYKIR